MSKNEHEEDYRKDLYDKLQKRRKSFVFSLWKLFVENTNAKKKDYTKKELCKILVSEHVQEVKGFYDLYRNLKQESVNVNYAKDYLNKNHGITRQQLNFSGRYNLLVLIYELGLQKHIKKIISRSKIESSKPNYTYLLNDLMDFNGLKEKINNFHDEWNVKKANLYPLRVEMKKLGENHFSIS
ncbi:MAG: hypothetical protein ACOC35_15790, partial [Promethearchaeia archaeon]